MAEWVLSFQVHIQNNDLVSGQIIIFHQPGFLWNSRGPISLPKRYLFWGKSAGSWGRELIWPDVILGDCLSSHSSTLPKFNIAPEKLSSQKESNLPTIIFPGLC